MTVEQETLTDLVGAVVGPGGRWTYQAFQARAVDPDTGYRPSTGTIQKIKEGGLVKINAELVRALAAGLGLPLRRVQLATAYQYTGLVVGDDPFPTAHASDTRLAVARDVEVDPETLDLTRAAVLRVLREIGADVRFPDDA
jgi:hypothetical protein